MTELSFRAIDLTDKQTAFTGLLASPVVAPWLDANLFALVHRHERDLEKWCDRLGYKLVRIDQCVRLRRPHLGGRQAVPDGQPPQRRPLIWALAAAASLEDQREDSITLQDLSDGVRRITGASGLTPYEPGQRAHRAALVSAVRLLGTYGVLEQRTQRSDLLDDWEREGAGIGAGYLIHRDALVLLLDTRDARLALAPSEEGPTDSRARLLRMLLETQAVFPLELAEHDRTYLASQRSRLIAQAEEMTGGTVELRADAMILILSSDKALHPELVASFPEATATDWVALMLLDSAIAGSHPDHVPGRRRCDSVAIAAMAAALHATHGSRLTVALRADSAAIREAAEQRLLAVGLLSLTDAGDWVLRPTAARYRRAQLTVGRAAATTSLFEEQS